MLEWTGRSTSKETKGQKKKRKLLCDLIFRNPLIEMWPDLWDVFSECCPHSRCQIAVVGNGPVSSSFADLLDSCDCVVRFNNYIADTDSQLVGRKCDVHIQCLHSTLFRQDGLQSLEAWGRQSKRSFGIENAAHTAECYQMARRSRSRISVPSNKFHQILTSVDSTRGFYGMAFALQMKMMLNLAKPVLVVGFGGVGHHFDPKVRINHNHDAEMKLFEEIWRTSDCRHLECSKLQPCVSFWRTC